MPLAHPINKAVENASPAMMVWALGITIADMAKRVDMRIYYLILAPTTYRDINIRSEIMEEPVMKSDATPGIRPFPFDCSQVPQKRDQNPRSPGIPIPGRWRMAKDSATSTAARGAAARSFSG